MDIDQMYYFVNMYIKYENIPFSTIYKFHFKNQPLRDFFNSLFKIRSIVTIPFDDSILKSLEKTLNISMDQFEEIYHEYTQIFWNEKQYIDEDRMTRYLWYSRFIECDKDNILTCLEEYKQSL
jgi:hypothetical protein